MNDEPKDPFFLAVAGALDRCQALELALKCHISATFAAARKYLDSRVIFKMDESDVEKKSLGQLIQLYAKMSDDEDLIKDLRKFTQDRNFLAHSAIRSSYLPDGTFLPSNEGMHERILQIEADADRLFRKVYDSGRQVLVHVWFDDITTEEEG